MLTIFYDGHCPMCATEMRHLKQHDTDDLIELVNIHQDNFAARYPNIEFSKAMKILHGTYQGELLLGLQVTHRAWTLVGKGFWVAPLNWPVIKTVSHWVYLAIAKYRHQVSAVLSRLPGVTAEQCSTNTCYGKSPNRKESHHKEQ